LLTCTITFANNFTISGHVRSEETGEELIGAHVIVKNLEGTGAVTNVYGFYSITLPEGTHSIHFSLLGYEESIKEIDLSSDITLSLDLKQKQTNLNTVVISAKKKNTNVAEVNMGKSVIDMNTINKIPALMGEVDVIKAIQLLPGVQTVGEGSSGLFVRGGGMDQNLILLDEAPIYNASHLMGFFSVFNPDAIKDVQLYKGGIPAQYGGRLSSILDVRMKEGNLKKLNISGGVGTVSSRLTIQAPINKNKTSFIVSGRRTYADQFLKYSKDKSLKENVLYFYDLNLKVNHRIDDKNRVFASGYFGQDVFKMGKDFEMNWGNTTGSIRWNHLFNDRLFSNFSLIYSDFDYYLGIPDGTQAFSWKSNITDINLLSFHPQFLGSAISEHDP